MKKNQKFSDFLFYVNMTISSLIFALLCTLDYLWHGIGIFSEYSLWIGFIVLF